MSTDAERRIEETYEFLTSRQGGIGASDVSKILGFSEYADALDVYHELTRPVQKDEIRAMVENDAEPIGLVRGRVLEPLAVREYWRRTGREGRHEQARSFRHPDFEGVLIHTDGTVFEDDDRTGMEGTGNLEAKAPRSSRFDRVVEAGIDEAYLLQVTLEQAVRRLSWGSLVLYSLEATTGPAHVIDVATDDDLAEFLLGQADRFWKEHVDPRIPPDADEWGSLLAREGPKVEAPEGDVIEPEEPELIELAEKVAGWKERKAEAEDTYSEAKAELETALRERDVVGIRVDAGTFRIVHNSGRSRLPQKRVEEHRPIDRDKFFRAVSAGLVSLNETRWPTTARALQDLELDLERLKTTTNPYTYLGVWT